MKKVFIVTGANGFLGNNIVKILSESVLIKDDAEIRAFILKKSPTIALEELNCKIYEGDVTEKQSLNPIFDVNNDAEIYVIHCAAVVYIKSKYNQKVYDVNVNGTKNIVDKVLEKKNAKLIYVSSVHAIEEKPNGEVISEPEHFYPERVEGLYAKTKAEIAEYVLTKVRNEGLNACILHPSGIIGPRDFGNSHLTQLIIDFLDGRLKACVKGGYDFVDVRDVAQGAVNACELGKKGECYILSNKYTEVCELLNMVSDASGKNKIKVVLPMWLAKLTAPLSEIYYNILKQPPLYTGYSLYTLTSNSNFSNAKAKSVLKYNNRSMEETIIDTVDWLNKNHRVKNY